MKTLLPARATKSAGIDQLAAASGSAGVEVMLNNWRSITPVEDYSAYNISTVYQCVRVLAETFAMLPLLVYKRLPAGGKDRAPDHELYHTLHEQPNPDMTSFVWRELLMSHVATWGNAYNEKVIDGLGRLNLYPIRPDRMVPRYDSSGAKVFDYLSPSGAKKTYTSDQIFHVQGLSSNGLVGISPIAAMRSTIDLLRSAETFGTSFFRNGARPAFIMTHPKTVSDEAADRLTSQMDDLRGAGNSGKTVLLEEGMTAQEIGVPPEDAQFLQTRLFQKREIQAAFRVPPHKVGDLERSTYSNIEQQSIEFIQDTMMPWFVRTEQEINTQLLGGQDDYFAAFLIDGYLRGDAAARAAAFHIMRLDGVINGDEWRASENMNPIPDGSGKAYWIPANYNDAAADPAADVSATQPTLAQGDADPAIDVSGPAALTVIKSMKELRCPDCNRKLAEKAGPGTVIICSRCKGVGEVAAEPIKSSRSDALGELSASIKALADPPNITVEAPIVNPTPVNVVVHTDSFVDAIEDLKQMLTAGVTKTINRDADGNIASITETSNAA